MNGFVQDVRYATRQLRKNPGFTLIAVVTLALGVGANTAIFSVIQAVILRPLPFSTPDRLVWLNGKLVPMTDEGAVSPPDFRDYRAENRTFDRIAAMGYAATPSMFAVLALLLAAIGLYGLMAYFVTQRRNEIGIRMALGATRADILRLVLRRGSGLAFTGVAIGLFASIAASRLLSSMLFAVSPKDPETFGAVALMLIAVALLACYFPARRAGKVDPMVALRYE